MRPRCEPRIDLVGEVPLVEFRQLPVRIWQQARLAGVEDLHQCTVLEVLDADEGEELEELDEYDDRESDEGELCDEEEAEELLLVIRAVLELPDDSELDEELLDEDCETDDEELDCEDCEETDEGEELEDDADELDDELLGELDDEDSDDELLD